MKSRIEIDELINVLEEIRNKQYQEVPSGLIRNIVYAEFEQQDDRPQGRKEVRKLMDEFLNSIDEE